MVVAGVGVEIGSALGAQPQALFTAHADQRLVEDDGVADQVFEVDRLIVDPPSLLVIELLGVLGIDKQFLNLDCGIACERSQAA